MCHPRSSQCLVNRNGDCKQSDECAERAVCSNGKCISGDGVKCNPVTGGKECMEGYSCIERGASNWVCQKIDKEYESCKVASNCERGTFCTICVPYQEYMCLRQKKGFNNTCRTGLPRDCNSVECSDGLTCDETKKQCKFQTKKTCHTDDQCRSIDHCDQFSGECRRNENELCNSSANECAYPLKCQQNDKKEWRCINNLAFLE